MITALKTRIIGITTFDLGEIVSLENIKNALSKNGSLESVGFIKRDPQFFNIEYCKPLLRVKEHKDTQIINSDVDRSKLSHDYQQKIKKFQQLVDHSTFRQEIFLSSSGIGCHFFLVEIRENMSTGDIITVTNMLVKYDATLSLRSGFSFSIPSRVKDFKTRISAFVTEKRTDYVRKYSVIHLVSLPDETIRSIKKDGINLYDKFENEFHALSVRAIEQWQDRYPEGLSYEDKNLSLSPVGILKINMRNSLFFEYPYDEIEIENLYYAAMVELRMWDMLVTAQLQHVQRILSRYEDENYEEVSLALIQKIQRNTLKTINEFDGFYLSTSKRVRNFYIQSYRVFHIKELLQLLKEKTGYLENILHNIQKSSSQNKQREIISQQRDLLVQANETAGKDTAIKFLLNMIGIITGLTLSLYVVANFKLRMFWNFIIIAIFGILYSLLFLWAKRGSKVAAFRARRYLHIDLDIDRKETILNLLKTTKQKRIKNIFSGHDRLSYIFEKRILNTYSTSRVEIAFHVADIAQNFNSTISIETTFKYKKELPNVHELNDTVLREILEMLSLKKEIVVREISPIEIMYYEH